MAGAAFFDLDRTLLAGASGPAYSKALRDAGVITAPSLPGEGLLFQVFDVIGETIPAMLLTRQAAKVAKGWDQATVRSAAKVAAADLFEQVLPYARLLIAKHHARRAAGRHGHDHAGATWSRRWPSCSSSTT